MRQKPNNKKEKDYSIRSINVKLLPTEEDKVKFDENIDTFCSLTDIGVNKYARLEDATKENISNEAKKMRKELKSPECSGTFVDLAIGSRGAESHFKTIKKMAKQDIIHRDEEIKKIEEDNPNLLKLKNVYFPKIKKTYGICTMCGREGRVFYKGVEPQYEEYLCEVCAIDFFVYREPLKTINRHIKKNYPLCKELVEDDKLNLSEGLKREINRFGRKIEDYKKTVSNKFKIKGGQLKMEFDPNIATITLKDNSKINVGFSGDYYFNNFPRYGKYPELNFKKLTIEHLKRGGYTYLIRRFKDGKKEYYLTIPTHYPIKNKEQKVEYIRGCILVSQRRVLLYINGNAEFIELFNPYIKKRKFEIRHKEIQDANKDLCICDWNKIPEKNHKFLINLRFKLGFEWVNEQDVTVTKSEDNNNVVVKDDNNDNRKIEITIRKDNGMDNRTAELRSSNENGRIEDSRTLYIVERKNIPGKYERDKRIDRVTGEILDRDRKMELYLSPQIPLPKKYAKGNLLKHIRHKNKETARYVVEKAINMLNGNTENSSIVLVDYTYIHPEKEGMVPMISLNDKIREMLMYDSIYGGSIDWNHLRILKCPNCNETLPERCRGSVADKGRLNIRDIFLSDTNSWICENDICNKKINSPLLAVARNIMRGDMKKFLQKYKKKDEDKEERHTIKDIIIKDESLRWDYS